MLLNPSFDLKLNRILEIVKDVQERLGALESAKKEVQICEVN